MPPLLEHPAVPSGRRQSRSLHSPRSGSGPARKPPPSPRWVLMPDNRFPRKKTAALRDRRCSPGRFRCRDHRYRPRTQFSRCSFGLHRLDECWTPCVVKLDDAESLEPVRSRIEVDPTSLERNQRYVRILPTPQNDHFEQAFIRNSQPLRAKDPSGSSPLSTPCG